jgi:tetratricopeptide (TPR) repeat protein
LDLIEHIAGAAEDAPLLILCPSRRELLDERPDWGHNGANGESISLDALSDAETELIVDNILGRSGLPKEASARITEAAQGNPLFVEQMLSMLIDDGVLQATDQGQWTLAGDLSNFSIPPNISALLSARLDRLLDEEQMVLERGAVVGQVFYTGAVQELSVESMRAQIGAYLSSLVRKELIAPDEESFAGQETWRFHHVLIRDSAYGRLLKRSRAELHERFGEWLERAAGTRAREYEEILGYHFEQAYRYRSEIGPLDDRGRQLATRAADLLASAGRRAFTREDMPATARLLERAVLMLPEFDVKRLELLPDLGEALMDIGAFKKAEAFLEQAIAGGVSSGNRRLEAYARLTHLALRYSTDREGCTEDVLHEVDRAIPIFEEVGDQLGLIKAWRLLASVHGTSCRYGAAEDALQHAIDHAKLAGDLRQELRSLPYLALCALYGPMPVPEAILRCEQILKDATGYRRVEALVLCALAHLQAMEGRFADARELYRRSRTTFEDIGGKVLAAATSVDSGSVELLADDPVAAEAELRRDYEVLSGIGETYLLSTTAALLAQALYSQGRFAEAERFSQISGQSAAPDDVESQVLWRCVEGKLLGRRGRVDEAEDLVREAVRLIADTEEPVSLGNALMDLAEVLCHGHKTPEAIDIIRRAVQLYDSKGNIVSATKARSQLADVSAKQARAEGP